MAVKLTDYHIQHKCKRGTITWDSVATGLGLRVTPVGRMVWILRLVYPGQRTQSRRTLGSYPAMSIADARAKAKADYALVKAGRDPEHVEAEQREAAERERHAAKVKAERAQQGSFRAVAEAFIASRNNRRAELDEREIKRTLIAAWGSRPITGITPRDVRTLIGDLAKRTPWEARNAWGHAVLVFKYAVHHELIDVSPCASLDKKMVLGVKLKARTQYLAADAIAALWRAALARGFPEGDCYRWLLMCGCRRGEALGMRWRELDLTAKVWTIPPDRAGNKSDEVRLLPLTGPMLELLATVPKREPHELVFSHTGEYEIGSLSKLKHWIDRHMANSLGDVVPWVNHDLRRTFRTNLSALGVADHVAELAIGHARTGIQRVYDQHRYLREIRSALDAWHARLAELVG